MFLNTCCFHINSPRSQSALKFGQSLTFQLVKVNVAVPANLSFWKQVRGMKTTWFVSTQINVNVPTLAILKPPIKTTSFPLHTSTTWLVTTNLVQLSEEPSSDLHICRFLASSTRLLNHPKSPYTTMMSLQWRHYINVGHCDRSITQKKICVKKLYELHVCYSPTVLNFMT